MHNNEKPGFIGLAACITHIPSPLERFIIIKNAGMRRWGSMTPPDFLKLRDFWGHVFSVEPITEDYLRFTIGLLQGYGRWMRLDQSPEMNKERAGASKAIRKELEKRREWINKAQRAVQNRDIALSWSRVLYEVLPKEIRDPSAKKTVKVILGLQRSWLQRAARLPGKPSPRITYWKSKVDLSEARSEGGNVERLAEESVLAIWRDLYVEDSGEGRLGIDFYMDFASLAGRHAASAKEEEQTLLEWFTMAALAGQHAIALTHQPEDKNAAEGLEYQILLGAKGRLTKHLDFVQVLEEAWQASLDLSVPNPDTGYWLAQEMVKDDQHRAVEILKTILNNTIWGEALLLLAEISKVDKSIQAYIVEYIAISKGDIDIVPPLNVALMMHALALVRQFQHATELETSALEAACTYYELTARSAFGGKFWRKHFGSKHWSMAVDRLCQLSDGLSAKGHLSAWTEVSNRFKQEELQLRSKSAGRA